MNGYYAVKVKGESDKVWHFITPKGGETRLRLHASLFDTKERAETIATEMTELNPGFAFKAVAL